MIIVAKTKKRVPYADELSDEAHEDLDALIKEAMWEGEETENVSNSINDMEVSIYVRFFLFYAVFSVSSLNVP